MKRALVIAAVFLALGAVLTIGVAWAAALWGSTNYQLPGVRTTYWDPDQGGGHYALHRGWPRWALAYGYYWDPSGNSRPLSGLAGGLGAGSGAAAPDPNIVRRLPLVPLWPGFVVDTLFYATGLWAVCFGAYAVRFARRQGAGRCTACGYPVGPTPACTECGHTHGGPLMTAERRRAAAAGGLGLIGLAVGLLIAPNSGVWLFTAVGAALLGLALPFPTHAAPKAPARADDSASSDATQQ